MLNVETTCLSEVPACHTAVSVNFLVSAFSSRFLFLNLKWGLVDGYLALLDVNLLGAPGTNKIMEFMYYN